MIIHTLTQTIYCYFCNTWYDIFTEIYLPDGPRGRVSCLKADHTIGYTWDPEWEEVFGSDNPKD